MKCPKCEYVRSTSDIAPEYQCPQCGVIYAKAMKLRSADTRKTKISVKKNTKQFINPKKFSLHVNLHPIVKEFCISLLKVIAGIVGFFAVLALIGSIRYLIRNDSSPSSATNTFDWNDALTMCQLTIKQLARDPETAEVPYVNNFGSGDEFYFAWGRSTKFARMRNGLGLEVPVSASCVVDGKQRKITGLTLDGKTVIGP